MAAKQFFDGATTTSAAQITATQGTITGQSTATWPPIGDYMVRIDGTAPGTTTAIFEKVLVTANAQGTGILTVTRGQGGTGQQAFAANATLTPVIDSKMVNDALARLDAPNAFPYQVSAPTTVATGFGTVPIKIDDILVGTDSRYLAATGQITFLNTSNSGTNLLPTGYRHLLIEWYARGDTAAVSTNVNLRFNNISTATYDYMTIRGTNATASAFDAQSQTQATIGSIPAASATANYFGVGEAKVMYYAGAVGNKLILAHSVLFQSDVAGGDFNELWNNKWRTAGTAITRIDLITAAGNFITGSLFTLWGLP